MWFFYSPTLIFGDGALDHLENVDGEKVFIVTDDMLVKLKVVDILTAKLDECGKKYEIFSEVEPDPHEETIAKAAVKCREYGPDLIIGLGGGSSLDTAKSVWVFYENPQFKDNPDEIHPFQRLNLGKKAKMITIPTTAGTGSETTWAVIITRTLPDGTHIKLEQANKELTPNIAIVDPIFTKSLPKNLTAATAFDAIGHLFEGLIASWRNDFSDAMSIKAFDLIHEYLARAYNDGNDMEAREKIANAATMAGLAFGNSQVIIGHTMAHVLGAVFHITHGLAVGIFLPYTLQFCLNDKENKEAETILAKFSKMEGIAERSDSNELAARKIVDEVKRLQKVVQLPTTLKEIGIKKEDLENKLDQIAQFCMESSSSVMSPRSASTEEFKKLFIYAYEGKDVDF